MALTKGSKFGIAAAVAATAGGLFIAGPAMAATATSTATATADASSGGGRGGSADTPVTGTEATKATDAVKAKDSSVTVTSVRKDPDGSYDVLGNKAGSQVMYDVSADLKTITQNAGGHGGGRGGSADTPVTGTEATKATDAVKAKDSSVTVTSVRKDPDGSYDVLGNKAGSQVMYDVSADLKTITQNAGGHGGSHGDDSQSSTGA